MATTIGDREIVRSLSKSPLISTKMIGKAKKQGYIYILIYFRNRNTIDDPLSLSKMITFLSLLFHVYKSPSVFLEINTSYASSSYPTFLSRFRQNSPLTPLIHLSVPLFIIQEKKLPIITP